jgi:hypothetical protein
MALQSSDSRSAWSVSCPCRLLLCCIGVDLDSIRQNFFVDNTQKEERLQALLETLEVDAEVYREGPSKIFPI